MANFSKYYTKKKIIMQTILFRADSSSTIGTGHIMRDLVLASQYKDSNVIFATQNLDGNINHKILEAGYKLELLKSNDIQEFLELVKKVEPDLVVIDSYKIDFKYEQKLKEKTDVKILAFDDTYEKHHCDILLNHNLSADKNKYTGLVPDSCELRCGIEYTLLRTEFLNISLKKRDMSVKKKIKVFIAMGGADSKNMNIPLLEEIKSLNFYIELVTTNANKNLIELQEYCANFNNINLHIEVNNVAEIVNECDIAILTPSVIVNELIFLKIPFISLMVTNNQYYMHEYLKSKGIPCISKYKITLLKKNLEELLNKEYYDNQLKVINNIITKRMV